MSEQSPGGSRTTRTDYREEVVPRRRWTRSVPWTESVGNPIG